MDHTWEESIAFESLQRVRLTTGQVALMRLTTLGADVEAVERAAILHGMLLLHRAGVSVPLLQGGRPLH